MRDTVLPRFRVGVLLMSPAMKEDSVCFLTVSFHILRIRLWRHSPDVKGPRATHPPGSETTCLMHTTRDLGQPLPRISGPTFSLREPSLVPNPSPDTWVPV